MNISRTSSVPVLDRCNPKIIRIVISRFFQKKNSICFILIKKQNNSNQSSLVIGPIGVLNSSKLIYLVGFLKAYGLFDF